MLLSTAGEWRLGAASVNDWSGQDDQCWCPGWWGQLEDGVTLPAGCMRLLRHDGSTDGQQ
jgi:hypothetical protein